MHGIVGGAFSVAQGGKFFQGFAANAVGAAGGGRLGGTLFRGAGAGAVIGRTAIAAVAGGTASAITGGKFANGAASAAIGHLFNHETCNHGEACVDEHQLRDQHIHDYVGELLEELALELTVRRVFRGAPGRRVGPRHRPRRAISKTIFVSVSVWGEAATHILDAQNFGHPRVLTVE